MNQAREAERMASVIDAKVKARLSDFEKRLMKRLDDVESRIEQVIGSYITIADQGDVKIVDANSTMSEKEISDLIEETSPKEDKLSEDEVQALLTGGPLKNPAPKKRKPKKQ